MSHNNNKILFANQLRGLAALLVLLSHWFGVYWGMRDVVSFYTASPIQQGVNPLAYDLVSFNPNFGLGPFGVSIFFLISGFVIPISIEKNTVAKFLTMRFFRVFPTYWFSLLIGLSCVYCSSLFWSLPLFWNKEILISNFFLANDVFQIASVDLVNWTLAIELKFYLVIAILSQVIRTGRVLPIFIFSLLIFILNFYLNDNTSTAEISSITTVAICIASELVYVQFMLIGIFFYYAHQNKISKRKLIEYSTFQLFFFAMSWRYSSLSNQFPVVPFIYFYGLAFFALAFSFRQKFTGNKFLKLLADISFPLYLIHSLVGYVTIKILMSYAWSFYAAASFALCSVSAIACAIHIFVETPTNAFGKKLSNMLAGVGKTTKIEKINAYP